MDHSFVVKEHQFGLKMRCIQGIDLFFFDFHNRIYVIFVNTVLHIGIKFDVKYSEMQKLRGGFVEIFFVVHL